MGTLNREGRLKCFFWAAPGVGKTFAMLEAGHARAAEGADVVIGFVETHGRAETARLLEALEVLPRQSVAYRGLRLEELYLDAALARKPDLLLVDELAHTNAPGARHTKRWQDVLEILRSGIDVYTTLNVQHVESLYDVVAQITGVVVKETVADALLERSVDVALVDLPPDELLQRLREGKIYSLAQAESAATSFFRKGNLIALRELSLRRTAERVDEQLRGFRLASGIEGLLHISELGAKVQKAEDVDPIGSAILVRVVNVDPVKKRVGLALASDGATAGGTEHTKRLIVGSIVKAVVEKVETYGVVVQINDMKGRAARATIPNAETNTRPGADLRKDLIQSSRWHWCSDRRARACSGRSVGGLCGIGEGKGRCCGRCWWPRRAGGGEHERAVVGFEAPGDERVRVDGGEARCGMTSIGAEDAWARASGRDRCACSERGQITPRARRSARAAA